MAPGIRILPPQEAMRIAAGEVIDRPAALVREFLDNAIDALSANIDVSIEEGGCKKVEVSDDGDGMGREDLELCLLAHATSKIRRLDDLETAKTLGFRGEALSAACAVSKLEIISSTDGREAWLLKKDPAQNKPPLLEQTRRVKGTTVRAQNLFETTPARKKFLKREGSEGALCRQAFLDKALFFNSVNFRFFQDDKLKDFLPAVPSRKERFAAALLKANEAPFLHEINVSGGGYSAAIVIGGPLLNRNDRRQMYVFANGRRISDYSLVQALDYGAQGWFPNGTHPVGAVFLEIDPSLADFNIHPAKREARFRDAGAIHQAVTGALRSFFHSHFLRSSHSGTETRRGEWEEASRRDAEAQREEPGINSHGGTEAQRGELGFEYWGRGTSRTYVADEGQKSAVSNLSYLSETKYIGRLFGLFILIEQNDTLYIIDQHAAHERILYDKFIKEPVPKQELLAPIPFTTESEDEDAFLEAKRKELSRLGIDIEKDEAPDGHSWRIDALPANWRLGDAATVREILNLRSAGENMAEKWAASLCCRAAIKDGDYPDDETAFELAKQALDLPRPQCPHGRPVWTQIGKEALFKAVRRID